MNQIIPILFNNFTEGKGPDGNRVIDKRQALQDGGVDTRTMHSFQSYGQSESAYDNNTYTIILIFDGEHLHMYAIYSTQPPNSGDRFEYHMNQFNG
jgi:hypothetical protein